MNQLLKGFETFGTDEGTIEGIQKKDADLTAHGVSLGNDLTREQARVNEVISNIPATTARMRNTSADINNASGTSTSDANRQWGELGSGTAGMTLGERRNYIDSITAYGTIDPNLDHLMPDSHDGTPWTMVDYDDYPEDGPPNPEYGPTRALSCIGSACGAFQEAEKGTGGRKTKMETYNPRFRSKTLAGETNFTEVPWDQVQAGDLIQNEDMTWRDYTDTSKGKVMRTHHAGIAETVNEDGSVNASNAQAWTYSWLQFPGASTRTYRPWRRRPWPLLAGLARTRCQRDLQSRPCRAVRNACPPVSPWCRQHLDRPSTT